MNQSKILEGLIDFQPFLEITNEDDKTIIAGTYQINERVYGEPYFEDFDVKVIITSKYPQEIPKVYVYGNRLDKCEHRSQNDMLCLETDYKLKVFLKPKPTLKEFLRKFLTSFLTGYLYYERYGEYPFGEHQHGEDGIIEMYQSRFDTKDSSLTLKLLEIVARKRYRGHSLCPCNSGKRIRSCHGRNNFLINMINSPDQELYTDDYDMVEKHRKNNRIKPKKGML